MARSETLSFRRTGMSIFCRAGLALRQPGATDAAIDDLVYELYGITGEERRIVDGM